MLQKRLIYLRTIHNLKQEDVAQYLGISRSTYSGYENESKHHRIPNAEIVAKLADLYNVSADYILGRTAENQIEHITPPEAVELIRNISRLPSGRQKEAWRYIISNFKLIEKLFGD